MATVWKVNSLYCEVLNQQDGTVIAHWKFDTGTTTDRFSVWWEYWNTTTSSWVLYESSTSSEHYEHYKSGDWFQSVWTPDDAPTSTKVRCYVRPWATKDSKGNYRWKSGGAYSNSIQNPKWVNLHTEFMQPPDLDLDYYQGSIYRITWDTAPALASHIIVYSEANGSGKFNKFKTYSTASANPPSLSLSNGKKYRFRACWTADAKGKSTGNLSLPTVTYYGRPNAPTDFACKLVSCNATSGSVKLSWKDSGYSGNGYTVEYSTDVNAWINHSDDIETYTGYTGAPNAKGENWCTITGLDTGKTYYFRLRRTESRAEEYYQKSGYATYEPKKYTIGCAIGTRPTAPTLGIVPAVVDVDSRVTLSWTHNSEDGSAQTEYNLMITCNGQGRFLSGVTSNQYYTFTPNTIAGDGDEVTWQVKTKGGLNTNSNTDWSPWSAVGKFTAYSLPSPTISVSNMDSYPLEIEVTTPPLSEANAAERCVVQIVAADDYETIGSDGETVYVTQGDLIWSGEHVFDGDSTYSISLMPQDAIFVGGMSYVVNASVITKLGMVGDATPADFECDISASEIYGCDCSATFDPETLAATVYPTCTDGPDGALRSGLTLSVWRVTTDGTELVLDNMPNDGTVFCVDPHPTFGECVYRVVAVDDSTGAVGYSDSVFNWKGPGIVIQWEESFDEEPSNDSEGLAYSGHRVVLPYNIDVSEQWQKQSSLNEWAGRKYPVTRYGTQRGHTATWSCDIVRYNGLPQTNEVRKLAAYMGDCHVREPYGSGYWAHIQVSDISYAHAEGAVHVTFAVTRVEA